MSRRQIVIVLSGLIFIGLIAWAIIYSIMPRASLSLALAPETGSLSIDGGSPQSVNNKQTITVAPGKHKVTFSRDEFKSYSTDVTVANKQTQEVIIALDPLTDAASKLLLTADAQEVIQRFVNLNMIKSTNQLNKDYPILNSLPIQARLYIINPCPSVKYPNDHTKIALCVDVAQPGLEPYVDQDISSRGFNPADYEIIFNTKINPTD